MWQKCVEKRGTSVFFLPQSLNALDGAELIGGSGVFFIVRRIPQKCFP